MFIRSMMPAVITTRHLSISEFTGMKKMEKLSSGKKINRAGDDASGLAISEKMRAQIRGLNMGNKNSQDAISYTQIADEVLGSVQDIQNRMRELSVQAASDLYTTDDRMAIQLELNQLVTELDDIFNRTAFNEIPVFKDYNNITDGSLQGLAKILKSDITKATKLSDQIMFTGIGWNSTGSNGEYRLNNNIVSQADVTSWLASTYGIANSSFSNFDVSTGTFSKDDGPPPTVSLTSGSNQITITFGGNGINQDNSAVSSVSVYDTALGTTSTPLTIFVDEVGGRSGVTGNTYGSAWIDFSGLGTKYTISDLVGEGFNSTCATCSKHYSIQFVDYSCTDTVDGVNFTYVASTNSPRLEINISGITSGDELTSAIITAVNNSPNFNNHYTQYAFNSAEPAKLYIYDYRTRYSSNGGGSTFDPYVHGATLPDKNSTIWVQTSANANDGFFIEKPVLNCSILGLTGISVLDQTSASNAISRVDDALNTVSMERAKLGAYTNRLQFRILNNEISSINLQSAESRFRDADMAKEMTDFTKSQILIQSGTAMQAQANSLPQSVLQLFS